MPMPSIRWAPGVPPESTADSPGSTATTRSPGWWARRAAQRRRGADRLHERVDPAAGLRPDLLAEGVVARDAVGVGELVGPVRPGLAADLPGGGDHGLDEALGDQAALARHESEIGAVGGHLGQLVLAEGVGGDDPQPVAADGADQGQGGAGAAAGVLHDGAAGTQPAVAL